MTKEHKHRFSLENEQILLRTDREDGLPPFDDTTYTDNFHAAADNLPDKATLFSMDVDTESVANGTSTGLANLEDPDNNMIQDNNSLPIDKSSDVDDYVYSMTDIIDTTGLTRNQIRYLVKQLESVDPADKWGGGVKRFTKSHMEKFKLAAELYRVKKSPKKIAQMLDEGEKYKSKGREFTTALGNLVQNPSTDTWSKYIEMLVGIDGIDRDIERPALFVAHHYQGDPNSDQVVDYVEVVNEYAQRNGLTQQDIGRILDRAYYKIGRALVNQMILNYFPHENSGEEGEINTSEASS